MIMEQPHEKYLTMPLNWHADIDSFDKQGKLVLCCRIVLQDNIEPVYKVSGTNVGIKVETIVSTFFTIILNSV